MSTANIVEPAAASSRGNRLTSMILVALILGIGAGYVAHDFFPQSSTRFADTIALLPTAFLRLVKMIIAPLVFATLMVGIAKMGDIGTVGRIGAQALGWFLVRIARLADARPRARRTCSSPARRCIWRFRPPTLRPASSPAGSRSRTSSRTLFPTSVVDAMARNEILQIVVFSVFFGVALAALGERSASSCSTGSTASR